MDKIGVAVTVRADISIIDQFVDYYLSKDYDQVIIFLDDPEFNFIPSKHVFNANVEFIKCDNEYWSKINRLRFDQTAKNIRPDSIEQRQFCNYHFANSLSYCDWLANIDIDEFIFSEFNLKDILTVLPKNIFSIRMRPFEAVYSESVGVNDIFNTRYFKVSSRRNNKNSNDFYDSNLLSNGGFWGHKLGKIFARTNELIKRMSNHTLEPLNDNLSCDVEFDFIKLLHFEGMSCDSFIEKQKRRFSRDVIVTKMSGREFKRLSYFKEVYDVDGDKGLTSLYEKMHLFVGDRLNKALMVGFIEEIDFKKTFKNFNHTLINFHSNKLFFSSEENAIQRNGKTEVLFLSFLLVGTTRALLLIRNSRNELNIISPSGRNFFLNASYISDFIEIEHVESFISLKCKDSYLISYPNGNSSFTSRNLGDWELFEKENIV